MFSQGKRSLPWGIKCETLLLLFNFVSATDCDGSEKPQPKVRWSSHAIKNLINSHDFAKGNFFVLMLLRQDF
jgi:hypothetical protein